MLVQCVLRKNVETQYTHYTPLWGYKNDSVWGSQGTFVSSVYEALRVFLKLPYQVLPRYPGNFTFWSSHFTLSKHKMDKNLHRKYPKLMKLMLFFNINICVINNIFGMLTLENETFACGECRNKLHYMKSEICLYWFVTNIIVYFNFQKCYHYKNISCMKYKTNLLK